MYLGLSPSTSNVPDITGYDPIRDVYIDRSGYVYKSDKSTGVFTNLGMASDYYASLQSSSGNMGYLAIAALVAAFYFMG
jgi:hypothetical protein